MENKKREKQEMRLQLQLKMKDIEPKPKCCNTFFICSLKFLFMENWAMFGIFLKHFSDSYFSFVL